MLNKLLFSEACFLNNGVLRRLFGMEIPRFLLDALQTIVKNRQFLATSECLYKLLNQTYIAE